MKMEINFLQLFAEPEEGTQTEEETREETKTFTQEELDKIVQDRIKREKNALDKVYNEKIIQLSEKVENLQKDKDFKDLSAEDRAKRERELEAKKYEQETQKLREQIAKLERESRQSDILSEYNKDNLPCSNDFVSLVPLIANIDDAQERADTYAALKTFVQNVEAKVKKELFKNESPNGSNGKSDDSNPFVSANFTEMAKAIRDNKENARELAKASGKWNQYQNMF